MKKTHFVLGGDIKKSLTDGYTLNFKQLFKDAFAITRSNFIPLMVACFVTVAIVAIVFMLSLDTLETLSETQQTLLNFIFSAFVITPLITGLQMMGVHHAIGLKSRAADLFNFFKIAFPLALSSMMVNIIVLAVSVVFDTLLGDIGLQLSLIVMLYLNMAFCLVYPLIAEKKLSAQLALRLSFKLVNKNLLQFTCLFLMLGLLAVIALLPSGLGMLLFVPFYFNLIGVVYRQLCGVGVVATDTSDDENNDDRDDNNDSDDSNNHSGFEA